MHAAGHVNSCQAGTVACWSCTLSSKTVKHYIESLLDCSEAFVCALSPMSKASRMQMVSGTSTKTWRRPRYLILRDLLRTKFNKRLVKRTNIQTLERFQLPRRSRDSSFRLVFGSAKVRTSFRLPRNTFGLQHRQCRGTMYHGHQQQQMQTSYHQQHAGYQPMQPSYQHNQHQQVVGES